MSGESLIIDTVELTGADSLVIGEVGFGILGKDVAALTGSGTDGGGVLANDLDPGDDEVELMAELVTPPSAGSLFLWPDGRFSLTGAADGAYSFTYRLTADGVDRGTSTGTVNVGAVATSVTSDAAGGYSIRGRVIADGAASFSVRAAVAANVSGAYIILGSATADRTSTYALRGAVVADAAAAYGVMGTVTAEATVGFAILGVVYAEMPCVYQLANAAPLLTPVTRDLVCSYRVLGRVESSADLSYNIAALRPLEPTGGFAAAFRPASLIRRTPRTRLPTKDPLESVLVEFDFSNECASISNARMQAVVYRGTDEAPQGILSGDVMVQGAKAYQRIAGGLSRVQYGIACVADTDDGDTLLIAAVQPVLDKVMS